MKKVYITILFVVVSMIIGYNYIYKDHRNIATEKAHFILRSSSIISEFKADAEKAQKKYLNKSIELTGITTATDKRSITLNNSIFCTLSEDQKQNTALNKKTTIKGRFIGYDDLLEEIRLDQTTILKL
jgi:hypothetical protein